MRLPRFWRAPSAGPEVLERVRRWRAQPDYDASRPPAAGRWVVVDVETSGLDMERDLLISVGALAVTDGAVDLGDGFEVVLRQPEPSGRGNIEVHGIAGGEQMAGEEPAGALADFLEFIGKDPLVAFHAPFDARMLQRACRDHLGIALRRPWLDLADVAPLAWPGRADPHGGLDAWLEALGIPIALRHRAVVDCLATAQLMIAVQREAPRLGARSARGLLALGRAGRWL